jgi:glycosyltransferase involved in cell wall biosynthesis
MTIGIDIRVLARGTRTGIEEYTLNLLSRLLSLDKDIKFKLFYNAFNKVELNYDWVNLPNVEIKKFNYPNRFVFDPLAKFLRLPKIDKMLGGVDVFFAPHFLLSPVSKDCRRIITFHDLSFEYFPEFFPWRKRYWHAFLNPRRRALEAEKIIAVSGSTKNDLVDLYNLPEQKIKVIYSGVGEEFEKLKINPPAGGEKFHPAGGHPKGEKIKEKYNLPERFILYFGTIEPRKNLVGLIRAYEIFREKYKIDDFKLVIAGSRGWLDKEIISADNNSEYHRDIIFTGFVAPGDKVYLYNLTSLFIYPSFFEGFGFPPLEAMACGVPTITSNTSCFPEVIGEAALMVDPYNFEEIAWAMNEVFSDEALKKDLIERGFKQAKKFSWDRCARETLEFFKNSSF